MIYNFFGTDGIRTMVGKPPLTKEQLPLLGYAIGKWLQQTYGTFPNILLAHDTRNSASFIRSALISGLTQMPITIYDADVLPTPAVCTLVKNNPTIHAGIIISASHNIYTDNGIKIIDAQGNKINMADELYISDALQNTHNNSIPPLFGTHLHWPEAAQQYINTLVNAMAPTRLDGTIIMLDCANGATSFVAPAIFKQLGAHVITLHNNPKGNNINAECGSVHPHKLQKEIIKNNAHIGFAFDGDGDRVIMVTKNGTIKDGDDMLALLANHPRYLKETMIVGTIMSNKGVENHLRTQNKYFTRVAVGDKEIAHTLTTHNWLLGGEPSGHIIMRDYLNSGDGIYTALRITEMLTLSNNWAVETFEKYPQLLINIPVIHKHDLTDPIVSTIITKYQSYLPNGRLEVRYSGTEPVLRIMIEDRDAHHAQHIGTHLSTDLQQTLSHLNS